MTESVEPAPAEGPSVEPTNQGLVLKNAFLLVLAQLVAMPLSVLVNAVMGRHLGAEDFGYFYLATTFCSFGFLVVEFGIGGALPALIARDRTQTGALVGASLVWKISLAAVVYGILAVATSVLGYAPEFRTALALVTVVSLASSVSASGQDAFRGFERTDINAIAVVGQQLLGAFVVVPVLMLGGKLPAALASLATANVLVAAFVWYSYRTSLRAPLGFQVEKLKVLLKEGFPFLALSLILALQPNVDAVFLSRMSPPEVVGWLAAAKKLVGALIFPVTALITALYPTLVRLNEEDPRAYARTANLCLRTSVTLVFPACLGCAFYPDLGIAIFSKESFGPAEENLRFLSVFLLLLYFSMTLGAALMAAGKKRLWVITQATCVVVSLALDPLLIPWFQARNGNGGLGVCVAAIVSETVMLVAGCIYAPRGVLDRLLVKCIALSAAAGGAMGAVVWATSGLPRLVSALVSVLVYFGVLWMIGGIDEDQIATFKTALARKFARKTAG